MKKIKIIKIENTIIIVKHDKNTNLYYIDHETSVDKKLSVCYPVISGNSKEEFINKLDKKYKEQNIKYQIIKW